MKAHAFEIVGMVLALIGVVKVTVDEKFLFTCVFLFVAIVGMGRIARGRSSK